MSWSNYHQHCYYCDGTNKPDDYVQTALANGIRSFGFSSHAPIPLDVKWCIKPEKFDNYLAEIKAIQQKYAEVLPIYIGMEIDFLPGLIGPNSPQFKVLDYHIGSVHFAAQFEDGEYWGIDDTRKMYERGINEIFEGSVQKAVEAYYATTRNLIENDTPQVLGHMDKIKMNNGDSIYFSEKARWYQTAVLQTLETIAATNTIVEVNTRGVYKKKTAYPYPSPWILKHLLDMDIPIMLNSDAHHPREVTGHFETTAELLVDIGFKEVQVHTRHGWQARPFTKKGIQF